MPRAPIVESGNGIGEEGSLATSLPAGWGTSASPGAGAASIWSVPGRVGRRKRSAVTRATTRPPAIVATALARAPLGIGVGPGGPGPVTVVVVVVRRSRNAHR